MPGQTLTLTIATQLQKAGFTEAADQMRNLQSQVDGVTKKTSAWDEASGKLKESLLKLGTVEFYREAAEEAGRAQEAQERLKTTVEASGASWARERGQINATNEALSEQTRFAKGDLDGALNILLQRTNSLSVSQANMQTVMGISVKTGRDLADVADQVGRAANGSIRDTQQLGKEFGIVGEKAKDSDYVLNKLAKTYGDAATKEETYAKTTKQMNNAWGDLKETFGKLLLPAMGQIEEGLTRLMKSVNSTLSMLGHLSDAAYEFFAGHWKKAAAEGKEATKDFVKQFTVLWTKNVPEAVEQGGTKTTAAAHKLRDELLQFVKDTQKETAQIMGDMGKSEVARLQAAGELDKAEIRKRADFRILSEQEKAKVIDAIDHNTAAKQIALAKEVKEKRIEATLQTSSAVGAAMGRMLSGETNAWQDATDAVIDLLVQQLTAALLIYQGMATAREIATLGFAGIATAAVETGIIAGIGSAVKGALHHAGGGGASVDTGSSAVSGGGGSYSGGGSSAAAQAAPAAVPQTNVRIVVQGDMVNDPAFTDRLVRRISEAVENRGVRLVATKVGA